MTQPPPISEDSHTTMNVPTALVPAVREMIARAQGGGAPPLSFEIIPPRPWTSIPMTISLSVVAGTWCVTMLGVVPKFRQIYMDFHMELPWSAQLVLQLSRWSQGVGIAAVWVVAIGLPFLITRLRPWPPRTGGVSLEKWVSVLCFVFVAALTALVVTGLYAPLIKLIEDISGGPPAQH